MKSVLQDWVMELPLRHQGVLICSIRGCDNAPKDDASKLLCRCFRTRVLNAFCVDPKQSVSFIEWVDLSTLLGRMKAFRKNLDHYPHHYVMHLIHAIEVLGYKGPKNTAEQVAETGAWLMFYFQLCKGCHMTPETEAELDARLTKEEKAFGEAQQ